MTDENQGVKFAGLADLCHHERLKETWTPQNVYQLKMKTLLSFQIEEVHVVG